MKRSSKKATLLMSAMTILVAFSIIVGMTYAWFTDTSITQIKQISSGTVDIEIQMQRPDGTWVTAEGIDLDWLKATGHETEAVIWEPGCTYRLPNLRIVNHGNLACLYKVEIGGITGSGGLLDAIEFSYTLDGADWDFAQDTLLEAGTQTKNIVISGHMLETAGNQYQNKTVGDIYIKVYAKQYTGEFDSNSNDYDTNAQYDN